MKTFRILGIVILLMVVGVFIWAAFLPSSFVVDKRVFVKSTRQTVYESIIDFKEWKHWSPWHDSTTQVSYDGAEMGVGAVLRWKNNEMEIGQMTIVSCHPDSGALIQLKAFETNDSSFIRFTFHDFIDSLQVGIEYEGEGFDYFMGRFEGFIIKTAMSQSSEIGLQKLKKYVENRPQLADLFGYDVEELDMEERMYFGIRDSVSTSELPVFMKSLKREVNDFVLSSRIITTGSPICVWESYDPTGMSVIRYAYPVNAEPQMMSNRFAIFNLPAYKVLRTQVTGEYSSNTAPWTAMRNFMRDHNYQLSHFAFEEFVTGLPNEKDTANWITYDYYPVTKEYDANE